MKTKHQLIITLILVFLTEISIAQVKTLTNLRPLNPTLQLGWDGTGSNPGSLEIRNDFSTQPINFITNGANWMTIANGGTYFGVGIATTSPSQYLDVSGGNITLSTTNKAYMIGTDKVLWNNSQSSCIYVGAGSGATSTGTGNTGVGNSSLTNSSGQQNTAVGLGSLQVNSSGSFNTALGVYSLTQNTSGQNNTAVGNGACGKNNANLNTGVGNNALYYNVSGTANTAVGALALWKNLASSNTAVGTSALEENTNGTFNSAVGTNALFANIGGNNNTALGYAALTYNTTTSDNTAVGYLTLTNNGIGYMNTAMGSQAIQGNTNGYHNAAFGYRALYANNIGLENTGMGTNALTANSSGNYNTALGYNAGLNMVSGTNNIYIGSGANSVGPNQGTLVNAIVIGSGATVTTNSTMILGDNTVNVGIGFSGSALTTNTKFDVFSGGATISGANSYTGHFANSNVANGSFGFPPTYAFTYGVWGESTGAGNAYGYNYGGSFKASNGTNCVGVGGTTIAPSTAALAYGGYFNSSFATSSTGTSHAVTALTTGNGAVNIAVYANAPSSSNNTLQNWAGQFVGDVYVTGNGWIAAAWNIISDRKYKTNIDTIQNAVSILKKLKPKSYNYDTANADGISFPYEKQYGFIAQDLQKVLPELVKTVKKPAEVDSAGKITHKAISHLGVNYNSFIALLTAAMQVQQGKIDSLEQKGSKQESLLQKQDFLISKQDSINKALQDQINQIVNNCCAKGAQSRGTQNNGNNNNGVGDNKSIGAINVELSNSDVIILNEAAPNPFAEQTLITFNIPEKCNTAQMLFYDSNGKLLKSVDIQKRGKGQMYVFGTDLMNGTYSYTLIVDGKIIDTKRMIKQQ